MKEPGNSLETIINDRELVAHIVAYTRRYDVPSMMCVTCVNTYEKYAGASVLIAEVLKSNTRSNEYLALHEQECQLARFTVVHIFCRDVYQNKFLVAHTR